MYKTTRGLILREAKYKEADRMLTILTEDEGKISARARGALRKGSRFSAATQTLCYSELTLFGSRGRWTVDEGSTVEQFLGLREDLVRLALGAYFAELLEAASDEDMPDPALLHLGLNGLYALSRDLYPPEHIKAVLELRLMCLAGFAPSLEACAVCGEPQPPNPRFSVSGGALFCGRCAGGEPEPPRTLCAASLAAMRHVCHAEPKKIFSFTLDEPSSERFHTVCETYLCTQLDRRFSSLDYWRRVK